MNEDNHTPSSSLSSNPQHNTGPVGFEHLESEARHDSGVDMASETRNGNDIGFEQLNREEASSNMRYRGSRDSETRSRQMSTEQLRAARLARFERSNY